MERYHPEVGVGGYSAVDGTVEFYLRVSTLLAPNQSILDVGAGRGAWVEDDSVPAIRRRLLDLRGDGRRLLGCDVDPIVKGNPLLDEAAVLASSAAPFPYPDQVMDIVISDWTFEHLANPAATAREMARVLKPGGWLCVRTPNKNGYISWSNRIMPTRLHGAILRRGQPMRREQDVFPTFYRLNTRRQIHRNFDGMFDVTCYISNPEPAYLGDSRGAWAAIKMVERLLPRNLGAVLLVFAQRLRE